jgi:hypothetical protein
MEDDTFKRILQGQTVPSTDQSRAEGNNTDVLERKDSMAKCYQRAWERARVTFPLFGQGMLIVYNRVRERLFGFTSG